MKPVVRQRKLLGNLVIGGDQWTDANMKNYNNVVLFTTPFATYKETAVWPEERHTADNTAVFYIKRTLELRLRNVFAFSYIENKVQAVLMSPQV